MAVPVCATCEFYLAVAGVCRRFPPVIIVTSRTKPNVAHWTSTFPPVGPDRWCGEYKPVIGVQN